MKYMVIPLMFLLFVSGFAAVNDFFYGREVTCSQYDNSTDTCTQWDEVVKLNMYYNWGY